MRLRRPSAEPLLPRSRGRGRAITLATALLAAAFALLTPGVASSQVTATIDPPDGPLYSDGVVFFSGTCASDPGVDFIEVDLTFSDPSFDRTGYAEVNGTDWSAASGYLGHDGPLTMTASISCAEGEDPATRTFDLSAPSLDLQLTVGTEPGVCATTTAIEVAPGTPVYWCYTAVNLSGRNQNAQRLIDDVDGTILDDLPEEIGPGASLSTVGLGVELTDTVDADMTRTGTWTLLACDGGCWEIRSAEATAQVTVIPEDTTTTTTTAPAQEPEAVTPTPAPPAQPVAATPTFTG